MHKQVRAASRIIDGLKAKIKLMADERSTMEHTLFALRTQLAIAESVEKQFQKARAKSPPTAGGHCSAEASISRKAADATDPQVNNDDDGDVSRLHRELERSKARRLALQDEMRAGRAERSTLLARLADREAEILALKEEVSCKFKSILLAWVGRALHPTAHIPNKMSPRCPRFTTVFLSSLIPCFIRKSKCSLAICMLKPF